MISIITPTFNSSKTIKRNLESVISQINCKHIQHIFVDNCSTDDTLSIISNYYSKNNIEYFIISEKDQGIYEAINKGLILAKYQIVHILNSDDYYYSPLIFDKILKIFNDKNINFVYGNIIIYKEVNNSKNIVRNWISGNIRKELWWMPPHPSLFLRKKVYRNIGYFNTKYKISSDYDFFRRMIIFYKKNGFYLNEYITYMKSGGISTKFSYRLLSKYYEDFRIINNITRNSFITIYILFCKVFSKISQFKK